MLNRMLLVSLSVVALSQGSAFAMWGVSQYPYPADGYPATPAIRAQSWQPQHPYPQYGHPVQPQYPMYQGYHPHYGQPTYAPYPHQPYYLHQQPIAPQVSAHHVTGFEPGAFDVKHVVDDSEENRGLPARNFFCEDGRVERAGVAIVKDYGFHFNPYSRFAVLVGVEAERKHVVQNGQDLPYGVENGDILPRGNFFGGGCEVEDIDSKGTAVEELYEESGRSIELSKWDLDQDNPNYFRFVYSGDFAEWPHNTAEKNYTQLFFYRKNDASVEEITAAMKRELEGSLPKRFRENKRAVAISLQDLLDAARTIKHLEDQGHKDYAKNDQFYIFQTRGDQGD